jgi:predicted small lipoprotein YifL
MTLPLRTAAIAVLAAGLALTGCGFKGPLTLPEKPGEVTVRPAPAGTQPAAPGGGAAPADGPKPDQPAPPPGPEASTPNTGGSDRG